MNNVTTQRNLAILIFDDVEVLDFCGPFEVFSVANEQAENSPLHVFTVAEKSTIAACNGLSVNPDYDLANCPKPDILIIPGGIGTRAGMKNERLIEWVKNRARHAEITASVCTGALLLGKAGLLNGLNATTHHTAFELLRRVASGATVVEGRRFVDNGNIITSGGIAAGIDMSLHLVTRLLGDDVATATAREMEYPWDSPASRES